MTEQPNLYDGSDALGYYRILQLTPDASPAQIKQNYRDLAKQWHPDHNTAVNALEIFQKLSVAYDVLKDDDKRLIYDLLSMAYNADKFPDYETIQPLSNKGGDVNVRLLNIWAVRGQLWKYQQRQERIICNYRQGLSLELKNSFMNWLLGWWAPQAFFKNIQALLTNFKKVNVRDDNLQMLVHNAIAYYHENKHEAAVQSAVMALGYANPSQALYLQKFIAALNTRVSRPKRWKFHLLQLVQLIFPAMIVVAALVPYSAQYVTEFDLMHWFSDKKEIIYYQEVNFGHRGRSVDDVVVGKIMSTPVDKSDVSKLYHLKDKVKVMYGPSDDFDMLKELSAQTTVRLTGMTPDNIWARIMIDNGEMGFVRMETLQKGIGKKVPEFSKIYQAQE